MNDNLDFFPESRALLVGLEKLAMQQTMPPAYPQPPIQQQPMQQPAPTPAPMPAPAAPSMPGHENRDMHNTIQSAMPKNTNKPVGLNQEYDKPAHGSLGAGLAGMRKRYA